MDGLNGADQPIGCNDEACSLAERIPVVGALGYKHNGWRDGAGEFGQGDGRLEGKRRREGAYEQQDPKR